MVDTQALLPLMLIVALFVGIAFKSRSLIVGATGGVAIFGYVAIKSGNAIFQGYYLLMMFFMVMGMSVYLVKTQMGDTA